MCVIEQGKSHDFALRIFTVSKHAVIAITHKNYAFLKVAKAAIFAEFQQDETLWVGKITQSKKYKATDNVECFCFKK